MERSGAIPAGDAAARDAAARRRRLPSAGQFLFVASFAIVGIATLLQLTSVASWWGQFGAAFSGRRQGWDASDFACFYAAAKFVVHGHGSQILVPDALSPVEHASAGIPPGHILPYLNPPFMAGLMAPLGLLSSGTAYHVWSVISLALVVVCCSQLWIAAASLRWCWRAVVVAGFLTLYPLTYALQQGQFTLWLVAAFAAAYNSLRAGHDRRAGAWLSVLLLKPELLLPAAIFLAWKRRYAVFATLAPIALVCVAASIAIVGPHDALRYPLYLRDISLQHQIGTDTAGMFGWAGLLGAAIGPEHPRLAMAFHVPLAVASIAAVALLWRGEWAADDETFGSRWFALALATVLADPHLYLQDTIVVAPAAIAWMCTRPAGMRAGAALTLVLGMFILGLGGGPNLHWHANLFVAWMGAVLATLVVRGMRSSRAMARSEHIEDSAIVPARAA